MTKYLLLLALALTAHQQASAEAVVGLHLVSAHIPNKSWTNNYNPGIYVKADNGLTVGVYYNTLSRVSVYAGYTLEAWPFALVLGATSGYKKHLSPGGGMRGTSNGYLSLMLAPSVKLPVEAWGVSPRLSFVPRIGSGSSVFHLSVERAF